MILNDMLEVSFLSLSIVVCVHAIRKPPQDESTARSRLQISIRKFDVTYWHMILYDVIGGHLLVFDKDFLRPNEGRLLLRLSSTIPLSTVFQLLIWEIAIELPFIIVNSQVE